MRNLQANAGVTVELGGETHAGAAHILQADTPDDQRARELLVEKYRAGDNLDEWGRSALPVVVEFLDEDAGTRAGACGRQVSLGWLAMATQRDALLA